MALWRNYKEGRQHSVVGNLLITNNVYSPQLNNWRDIMVWLPYHYDGKRHYPVIYMHDGYNLFDSYTSFVGEWQVDETMTRLVDEGIEAIVVGIPNNEDRMREYSPFADARFGMKESKGDAYLSFIADTLKPRIAESFRTLSDSAHTGIIGSSMGGLISLYALLERNETFGFAGAMSPSLWFGHNRISDIIARLQMPKGRLYLDIGGRESRYGASYMRGVRKIADTLAEKGYHSGNLMMVEDEHGEHNETTWARRLPTAIRFLLAPMKEMAK